MNRYPSAAAPARHSSAWDDSSLHALRQKTRVFPFAKFEFIAKKQIFTRARAQKVSPDFCTKSFLYPPTPNLALPLWGQLYNPIPLFPRRWVHVQPHHSP